MKLLKPFEALYQTASAAKNFLYDKEIIKSVGVQSSVVSVGNLSFGGTGKTPCIEFLATELATAFKVAIVCRSYKTPRTTPAKVDLKQKNAAELYGDEACLLQKKLPQCSIWTGPQKYQTALACQIEKPDLILVDDGFSHRKLQRDFDLVLIDVSESQTSYFRENLKSLQRAHAVLLTKTEGLLSENLQNFKLQIIKAAPHLEHSIFLAQSQTNISVDQKRPLFAFCGLAKPESFRAAILKQGYSIQTFKTFADHFAYSEASQVQILQQYLQQKKIDLNLALLTTEKDLIKLTNPSLLNEVNVATHQMILNTQDKVGLFEKIRTNL